MSHSSTIDQPTNTDSSLSDDLREAKLSTAMSAETAAQFDYKPVPTIAPITLFMGLFSLVAFWGLFGIVVALFTVLLGLVAWRTIANANGQYGGTKMAVTGALLAVVSFGGGIVTQIQNYKNELPEGFQRLSFNEDISLPGLIYERRPDGALVNKPPASVQELEGKEVFIKGFMYPEEKKFELQSFLLVKDSGDCCFGGQPPITDMIGVVFDEETTEERATFYNQVLVSVAGTFHIRNVAGGQLEPIYEIQATHFTQSKSSF